MVCYVLYKAQLHSLSTLFKLSQRISIALTHTKWSTSQKLCWEHPHLYPPQAHSPPSSTVNGRNLISRTSTKPSILSSNALIKKAGTRLRLLRNARRQRSTRTRSVSMSQASTSTDLQRKVRVYLQFQQLIKTPSRSNSRSLPWTQHPF